MSSSKRCKGCGEVKPLTEFYALRPGHSGRVSAGHFAECKICNTARAVAWQKANPGKAAASRARYARNRKLREVYGITPAEYEALLTAQDGKCEICGTSDPGRGSEFFPVDHDHETGKRRGLLCHDCNLGISHFADDPERLMAAAAYLFSHQELTGVVF